MPTTDIPVQFDAEALRQHVTEQLNRILSENELRVEALSERFTDKVNSISDRLLDLHKIVDEGLAKADPTELTNTAVTVAKEDIRREISAMHELTYARMDALEGILARVAATLDMSPAERERLRERLQGDIKTAVENLAAITNEKFSAVQGQFDERDTRGEQEKKSSKEALDAALLAQKESVSQQNDANTTAATKSETSFTKQIDQIGTLIATLEKSLTDRITELKERIDRGEGVDSGQSRSRLDEQVQATFDQYAGVARQQATRQMVAIGVSSVSALIAIVAIIVIVVIR